MTDQPMRPDYTTVEVVAVNGSRTDHYAPVQGVSTLCGRVAMFPIRFRALRPLCAVCKATARRDHLTINPLPNRSR